MLCNLVYFLRKTKELLLKYKAAYLVAIFLFEIPLQLCFDCVYDTKNVSSAERPKAKIWLEDCYMTNSTQLKGSLKSELCVGVYACVLG